MSEDKAAGAFRTIGEVSEELALPQHILRYWETRFPQLRPLQRAGKRRYYRPDDIALVRRINRLLNQEGYTIKGVQKLLGAHPHGDAPPPAPVAAQPAQATSGVPAALIAELKRIRAHLSIALVEDRA
ncbi:MerR family transcriptional regulator [Sphingomonas flavalba]|uniref:MerR family transcriptional regulator n=1 Tax=Sphingomonas flavalba TaxID=2559804 RepID=UPI00109DBA20|nr:MerR family transcriptional regulator [Sphingomonas flavalba]